LLIPSERAGRNAATLCRAGESSARRQAFAQAGAEIEEFANASRSAMQPFARCCSNVRPCLCACAQSAQRVRVPSGFEAASAEQEFEGV